MDSFAFWYKKRNPESEPTSTLSAVMNFNLWCECGWDVKDKQSKTLAKEEYPYLDIGFKITNLSLASDLYLFLPLVIEEDQKEAHLEDLGCKFKDTALVDATFNESFKTSISASSKTIDVESSDEDKFKIYQLDIENDVSLSRFSTGTILTLNTDKIISNQTKDVKPDESKAEDPVYYFRFRIKGCPLEFLIHKYSARSKVLQGLFNETYMIDFRYHNIRSLDNSLIERFYESGNGVVDVTALHFLLMTKAYVDVTSQGFTNVRKIEFNVWKEYVDGHDTKDLVAYHFADKPKKDGDSKFIGSSELFAKFRIERSLVRAYVVCATLIGVLGSAVWCLIEYLCTLLGSLVGSLIQIIGNL